MTRKRAKKLLMAMGFTRDTAESALIAKRASNDKVVVDGEKLVDTFRAQPYIRCFDEEFAKGYSMRVSFGGKDRTIILSGA